MKNACCVAVCLLCSPLIFAQGSHEIKQISVQSNGVVVHESSGVEGFSQAPVTGSAVRELNDWSLPECIDALAYIDAKLQYLSDTEEDKSMRMRYMEQKAAIESRRKQLSGEFR